MSRSAAFRHRTARAVPVLWQPKFAAQDLQGSLRFHGRNDNAELNFAGVQHLHVDVMCRQRAEDTSTNIRVASQTNPGNRQLANMAV